MELSTIRGILNQVYAGKKLTLEFATPQDREEFRVKLYKLKSKEDDLLRILEETLYTLKFDKTEEDGGGEDLFTKYYAKVYIVERRKPDVFKIVEIEDEPSQPPNLGTTGGPEQT